MTLAELFGAQVALCWASPWASASWLGLRGFDLTGSQAAFLGSGAMVACAAIALPLLALLFRHWEHRERHVGSGERRESVAESVGSPKSPLAELNFQSDSEGPHENSLA